MTTLTKLELDEISYFINQSYGLEFREPRLGFLEQAVQKRLKATNISAIYEYLRLLKTEEQEALALIKLLTVHETYFFREPKHFEVVTRKIIPQLIKKDGTQPFFRVLSAGCSTGEEVYSLAIAILSMPGAGTEWDFEVVGVDVDIEAIKKSQRGVYGLYSFRACPPNICDTYFEDMSNEQFMVKRFVKEKVRFKALNLFAEVYPQWLKSMDIIFFRNVSIYFSKAQRKEIFSRLTTLLKRGGALFLSSTETLYQSNAGMSLAKSEDVFYYCKENAARVNSDTAVPSHISLKIHTANKQLGSCLPKHKHQFSVPNKAASCQQMFANALELTKAKQYEKAVDQLNKIMTADAFFIRAYTLKANILLNQQKVDEAAQLCQAALVMDDFCLEAYLLLGMAAKLAGAVDKAIQHFKEAVYVCPECWLAHFYLAEAYQLQQASIYAKREYQLAMRILEQGNFDNHGLSCFLAPFKQADITQLCQYNIAKLCG
ncbi:MAG: tetratricopeptide repeat protein [Pelosinus sp.]|nr:tetratricopeptide repeat protein [Pelosinus sp.]